MTMQICLDHDETLISTAMLLPRVANCFHGDQIWHDVMERTKAEILKTEGVTSSLTSEIQNYCHKSGKPKSGKMAKKHNHFLFIGFCDLNLKQ